MAINKKLIHFRTKAAFTTELNAGNIPDTSIVFIKDTKEIWTHGQLYSCSLPDAADGVTGGIQIGYAASGRNYALELLNKKAYVNVPWTDQNVYQAFIPDVDNHAYSILGSAETTPITAGKAAKSVYLKGLTFTPALPTDNKSPSELGSIFTDTTFPAIVIPLPAVYVSTNDDRFTGISFLPESVLKVIVRTLESGSKETLLTIPSLIK